MHTTSQSRGMMILELMLYVALASVVLGVAVTLYVVIISTSAKTHAVTEVETNATGVLVRFSQLLHDAERVATPTLGAGDTTLILEMKDSSRSPAIMTLVDGVLLLQEGDGPTLPITAADVRIENISFGNTSSTTTSDFITMQFDAQYLNPGERNELEYAQSYHASATTR